MAKRVYAKLRFLRPRWGAAIGYQQLGSATLVVILGCAAALSVMCYTYLETMPLTRQLESSAGRASRKGPISKPAALRGSRDQTADRRREGILEWMRSHRSPVHGGELARRFRVSRQCLVQDVAILRAGGQEILGTPRGYRLPAAAPNAHKAILACKHSPERTEEELNILADHGVKVLDVIVEHPLYGEMRGSLMIESRADVQDFLKRVSSSHASLLSSLTGGVHLHTVEASRPEMIARAKEQLRERGFLLK